MAYNKLYVSGFLFLCFCFIIIFYLQYLEQLLGSVIARWVVCEVSLVALLEVTFVLSGSSPPYPGANESS